MHRRFIINEVLHIFAECGAVTYCGMIPIVWPYRFCLENIKGRCFEVRQRQGSLNPTRFV